MSTGLGAHELCSAAPDLKRNTARAIVIGRIPGTTQAATIAQGLRVLAERYTETAATFVDAADRMDAEYKYASDTATDLVPGSDEAQIIALAKARENFEAIGKLKGVSRERVRQIVERYEKRTGEKLPRYGK